MHYAAKNTNERAATGALASHLADLDTVSREAEVAGDLELAVAIESHALTVQRCPQAGVGSVTLVMQSGRRVPLRDARAHIRRTGRPTSTGGSSLAAEMDRLSARCRAISSAADQMEVADVLAGNGRAAPVAVPRCVECGSRCDEWGDCPLCDPE